MPVNLELEVSVDRPSGESQWTWACSDLEISCHRVAITSATMALVAVQGVQILVCISITSSIASSIQCTYLNHQQYGVPYGNIDCIFRTTSLTPQASLLDRPAQLRMLNAPSQCQQPIRAAKPNHPTTSSTRSPPASQCAITPESPPPELTRTCPIINCNSW